MIFCVLVQIFWRLLPVLQPNDNCALCKWLVNNNFANGVHRNKSACNVFDANHMGVDVRLYFTSFKCKVTIHHLAVYKFQTFAVAKWLCANDGAVFEGKIFRIPSKVLALDRAVTYNNVFGMPKCIFCIQIAVFNRRVGYVLEGVLALEVDIVQL